MNVAAGDVEFREVSAEVRAAQPLQTPSAAAEAGRNQADAEVLQQRTAARSERIRRRSEVC